MVLEGSIIPLFLFLPKRHPFLGRPFVVRHDCNEWLPGSKHKPVKHGMFNRNNPRGGGVGHGECGDHNFCLRLGLIVC